MKKLIAMWLIGIFLMPFVFRSIHSFVAHHHSDFAVEVVTENASESIDFQIQSSSGEHNKSCFICEFQFAIPDFQSFISFCSNIPYQIVLFSSKVYKFYTSPVYYLTFPRAPPYILF